jgi:type II secretory pathway pseudopilin PulG
MKNEQNHKLGFIQLAVGFGLLALVGLISLPSWIRHLEEEKVIDAQRHAEILGYQVFEIYGEAARNTYSIPASSSRSPASAQPAVAGSIGKDPWGQPYRYKILSSSGSELKLQVWSAGPNKRFETADEPGTESDTYLGDDVGIVLSMNHKPSE